LLFALHFLFQTALLSYFDATAHITPNYPPFTGCLVLPSFPKFYLIFLSGIAFDTCMVILTVIQSYPMTRGQGIQTSLWTLLLRDGLIYYFCVIAARILSLVVSTAPVHISVSTPILSCAPSVFVVSIASNRLFIHLETVL
ncbi:hypothetical protein CPB86DRAFT_681605, partial [Serendipita vermifera]